MLGGGHSVYPVFAAAARHWWADKPLYADYHESEGIDGYRYSPAFAVAFTPYILLPERVGEIAWNLTNLFLLFLGLEALLRHVLADEGFTSSEKRSLFLVLALAGSAVGLWSAQSNALLTALILFSIVAVVRNSWWSAAWSSATAVFIKIWPLAWVMLLLVRWPRELFWRFAAACTALAAIPFFTRPPEIVCRQYKDWYLALTGTLQGRWPGYRDAWTVWEQLFPPVAPSAYKLLQLVAAFGVLLWWLFLWKKELKKENTLSQTMLTGYGMWAAWQLLFGPGTEQLTYGLIAPATAWAVILSFARRQGRVLALFAWCILALLSSGDIEQKFTYLLPTPKIVLPLGVVLFVGWLAGYELSRRRAGAGTNE